MKVPAGPVRVLGVGSPFGADRVGWDLVSALRGRGSFPEAELLVSDRPGASLLAAMEGAQRVLVVDAMRAGLPLGSVHALNQDELDWGASLLSTHGFGVAEALDLGRALGLLPPRVVVIGIEIGEPPSPPLARGQFERVLEAVSELIATELRTGRW